jgi:DMSO reductase anchor subunit
MGGSFNTREFRPGRSSAFLTSIQWFFLLTVFLLPTLLLAASINGTEAGLPVAAFIVQYSGLVAERWFFFAQASHPQNLYYQSVA